MKMKQKNALIGLLCVGVAFSSVASCSKEVYGCGGNLTSIVQAKTLVVGTEAGYKPFEYLNVTSGAVEGFDVDFMNYVGSSLSKTYSTTVNVVFKDMDFDGLIGALQANQIDCIAAAFSITEERAKSVEFSDEYFTAQTVVVVKEDCTSITDMASLKSAVVGAQLGTVQGDMISADGFNSANKTLKNISDLLLALQAGQLT